MFENPFLRDKDYYTRDIAPIKHYTEQVANLLSITKNIPIETATEFVKTMIREKKIGSIKDPGIIYYQRQQNGDRVKLQSTLNKYISDSLKNKEIIVPTLTTYVNPEVEVSFLAEYVEKNIALRNKAKKQEFAADSAGKKEEAFYFNSVQTNKKISNNSLSGASQSASTPLINPTAHSSLTSMCRNTSGFGNANNEKFLSGNRHYWSYSVVLNNIASIVYNTEYDNLIKVIDKYKIYIPTVNDVMDCISYSTNLYWRDEPKLEIIRNVVNGLSPIHRAAFVYIGDLFHLAKYNRGLVYSLITKLITKVEGEVVDARNKIRDIHESHLDLGHQICLEEMSGKGKRYDEFIDSKELQTLVMTCNNIRDTLIDYSDLIKALWLTKNVPASVGYLPNSVRRLALVSDTDSTIFTVYNWIYWYFGNYNVNIESLRVAATMIFLASESITHVLALMSANFGVEKKRLNEIAMKNEFAYHVLAPTDVTKHYLAKIGVKEGQVYWPKYKDEIKGAHLKSSNSPKRILTLAGEFQDNYLNAVLQNKKISYFETMKFVADVERDIMSSLYKGELEFYRLAQIKDKSSYKNSESSPYGYYELWQEVFAPKYGDCPAPPYATIKIPTIIENPTATKDWLANIKDEELRVRLQKWMLDKGKTTLPTLYIPSDIIAAKGMLEEIKPIIAVRRTVLDLCNIFYINLGILGIQKRKEELISDTH